jgi:tRNA-guanine family transglycosylase
LNIRRIREILGDDRYLHGFGIGSYTLVPACIYLGVSSVDSTLWSIKAGMKEIIVPGVAARSLRGSKGRQFLSKEESTITCDCPICNGRKISDVKSTYLDDEKKGRIHNAWVQIKDVEMLTEAIKQKKLFAICKERIERDPKKKSLLEVLQHVHTKLVSLC